MYIPNIPEPKKRRLVIVGGGFAGMKLVQKSLCRNFQIVLLDRNNYHQFQPLLYQVATAGLEPSAVSFPLRKVLQKEENIHYRMAELIEVFPEKQEILTNVGLLKYDILVLAMGASPNFFEQINIQRFGLSLKSASDAILIRNTILENFEKALLHTSPEKINEYLNIVLVGGGPTGVELSGALAEMKKYIFPKDYPELDLKKMRIVLYEASSVLLAGMSSYASKTAKHYLETLGIEVYTKTRVLDYDGTVVHLSDDTFIRTKTLIWAAGVKVNKVKGLDNATLGRGGRLKVNRQNQIIGYENIFALGDISLMETPKYPDGHPQVAQAAIQQAKLLAKNFSKIDDRKEVTDFEYRNKGTMATVGRNLAVADLPIMKLKGYIAWILWSFVHLFTIMGVKNRLSIFINWTWNYFTYDQSLRVLIRPKIKETDANVQKKYERITN